MPIKFTRSWHLAKQLKKHYAYMSVVKPESADWIVFAFAKYCFSKAGIADVLKVTGAHEPAKGGQGASNYCGHVLDKVLCDHDLIRKVSY